jgi:hypothetical protein
MRFNASEALWDQVIMTLDRQDPLREDSARPEWLDHGVGLDVPAGLNADRVEPWREQLF